MSNKAISFIYFKRKSDIEKETNVTICEIEIARLEK